MDNNALPITYELFAGNTNDCLTYRPNFTRIKKGFDLSRVISTADKGMTTGDNIWIRQHLDTTTSGHDNKGWLCVQHVCAWCGQGDEGICP
ncbi:hypothetical protein LQZ18_15300 [Lachnospiraceae bacterium ZAX-1]